MIGPRDLSGSIGKPGDYKNKKFINALKKSVDPRDVSKYVNLLVSNSFDFDFDRYELYESYDENMDQCFFKATNS